MEILRLSADTSAPSIALTQLNEDFAIEPALDRTINHYGRTE
jgi:hypothetical protein